MTVENWQRVKELLDQALDLAPEQRARFLDEACASDAKMRTELDSLLSVGEQLNSGFLKSPLPDDLDQGLAGGQLFAQRFQLIRKLGQGGMGQVWLAEQLAPVRRPVALKLIRAGMYDESALQRFQSERQSLAIMDHPTIAKVFDAGTARGQPYFVMEYVPGMPITEYCDQNKLTIKARLELFIRACEGVQHAHQKAIIHRDLKPANILVVDLDGAALPRIIDFGLARAATTQAADPTLLTRFGILMGTPGYMSPEQLDPKVRDIDTRTDVYSLGVVLYVLLTGLQPFEIRPRHRPALDEWLRQVRDEEPPAPSAKVEADLDTRALSASARACDPRQLSGLLRGDLDCIALKALERDRERRYATPMELAADLRRHLDHQPIVARPASGAYRLRKYVRRHQVAAGVAASLLAVLGAFSVMEALHLREMTRERDRAGQERDRANLERDRANQERDRATRIADFMTDMFKVADPTEARGSTVTAREILDKASDQIGKGLAQDPDVQSQMMYEMAGTYNNLGLHARAQTLAQRALDARMNGHGPQDPRTLRSMTQLGWILHQEGHDEDAEALERRALAQEERTVGADDPLTIETRDDLGMVLKNLGKLAEAEQLARAALDAATRRSGAEGYLTLLASNHLGAILYYEGHGADAQKVLRPALEIERRVWGADHPETMNALTMLAISLHHQNQFAQAEPLYREILATNERVLGPEHRSTAVSMGNLAALLNDEGHFAEASKLYRQALAILTRTLGPDHPSTLMCGLNLSRALRSEDRLREAEALQRQTLATEIRAHGPEYPDTLLAQSELAATLFKEGRYAAAEKLARDTFDIQLNKLGPQHPDVLDTLQHLGMAMAFNHHYAQAQALFAHVIDAARDVKGSGNRWYAWYALACVAATSNHGADALHYLHQAIERGLNDAEGLAADDDLKNLRSNPDFVQLLADVRQRPAATSTP